MPMFNGFFQPSQLTLRTKQFVSDRVVARLVLLALLDSRSHNLSALGE